MVESLADAALKYLGTPFHHQGRARKTGLDCIGLFVVSFEDIGGRIRDYINYKRSPDGTTLVAEMGNQLDEVDKDNMKTGDIILFYMRNRKYPQHIGIKTEKGFVHTYIFARKVVEDVLNEYWLNRIHSVYRVRCD